MILKERNYEKALMILKLLYNKDEWKDMYLEDEGRILIIEL